MIEAPRWTRVVLRTSAEEAELAADRLWAFEPAAVEVQDGPEGTVLLAGFALPSTAAAALAALHEAGLGDGEVVPVDDDGLDGWRPWARVQRAGPFAVVPAWLDPPAPGGDQLVVRVDPGRTFGSGSHATTRLVLARLAQLVRPGATVLDVGCGSGILAVGAALLGAARVLAIDVDPGSPAATTANADRNGVGAVVSASSRPLEAVVPPDAPFDLVVANLLAPIVVDLADHLERVVVPGGALVVSGLLDDRWAETTDRLTGLTVTDVATDDGWAAITLTPSAT